MKDILL